VQIFLSKSKFLAGCQCLKRLYWQVHEPEMAAQPDASDEAIMEQGREVGLLARRLFPGGIEVNGSRLEEAIRITKELVANPEIPAIFEAAFHYQGVVVRTDILRRRENRWRLVEVKSTTDLREYQVRTVDAPESLYGQILCDARIAHDAHNPGVNVPLELLDQRLESIDVAKRKSSEQIHELLYCLLRGRNEWVTSIFTASLDEG